MKKREIINKIEKNSNNYYRNIANDCLKHYSKLDNFEKAILSELICRLIEKNYSLEECLATMSKEYNVNCKKIVLFAIMPSIKMPTLKAKFLFLTNINAVISQCINLMKQEVVQVAFKGTISI